MKNMKKLVFATALMFLVFVWVSNAQAATLSLSPSSGNNSVGSIFTVTILLNTQSQAVDGVDIRYLNYSPTLLEVQDDNTSLAGVQILAGTLFGNTVAHSVATANGRISFSQVAVGGSTYSNSANATLATVRFRVLTTGTALVTFNFALGSTADTNVAAGGSDVLTSVTNGSYILQDTNAPSIPTGLTATAISSSRIDLSWTASTDNVGVTGYNIYRCTGSGCTPSTQIATSATNSYSNTGLSASTGYVYRVAAYDAAGNVSAQSSSASATTQNPPDVTPPTLSAVTAFLITSSGATITWTTNENSDSQVEYGLTTSYGSQTTLNAAMVISHSQALSGLSVATLYHYRVKSKDAAGNLATSVDYTFTTIDNQAPTVPTNFAATPVSPSQINLSWTASTDNVGVAGYHIYRNSVEIANIPGTSYQNTGLTPSTSYTYAVSAYDAVGNGSFATADVIATTWPSTSNKFSINNRVKTAGILNVRQTPSSSGTLLGTQLSDFLGTVIGGPTYGDGYYWWQINYDIDPDGWSIESSMDLPPVLNSTVFTPTIEGATSINARSFTFNLYNVISVSDQAQFTASGNASNQVILPSTVTNLREDRYNVYVKSAGYLKVKITDTRLASGAIVPLSALKAGNLNDDGIINSLDWSSMNLNWFTNDITSDINKDGIVNTIDFSWMNKNWLQADAT